jgi:hypothetical protein
LQTGISARLLRAYRRTTYMVAGIELRIGRRSAAADTLLLSRGAREGVLITAWNPRSRPMPEGWNRRAQNRLAASLRPIATVPAEGRLDSWREAHVLALGPASRLLRPARRFRQNALVRVAVGRKVELLLIRWYSTALHG